MPGLEKRVHVLKRLSWIRMIFLRIVDPDSETRKRAHAFIEQHLGLLPITLPATLTSSPG